MEDKYYPIMDKPYTELICEEIEDETVAFVKSVAKVFYKAKSEIVTFSMGTYMNERFIKRIERFEKEEELLSPQQIKTFYDDINETKLDILFELLEKTRTSTFDLQAKILAKLYGNYLRKNHLNMHEITLISNINIFNEADFLMYKWVMMRYFSYKKKSIEINIYSCTDAVYNSLNSIQKFLNLGFFTYPKAEFGKTIQNTYAFTDFIESDYSKELYEIISEITND